MGGGLGTETVRVGDRVRRAVLLLAALLALALAFAPRAGAYVYWANGGSETIGRANLDGSSPNQSFIGGASGAYGVAVDSAHVYWTSIFGDTIGIGRANLDGSSPNQSFIPTPSSPVGVAVDGAHVYWADGSANSIGRADLDGNPASVNQSFIATASGPFGVAVDGEHVYWTNSIMGGTIGRANLDGSSPNQSFIGQIETGGRPAGVAVDSAHVYWTRQYFDTGAIGRANLDGTGAGASFISTPYGSRPIGVAVDGLSSGQFTLGKPKLNKKKGTAKLPANVPGPGSLKLAGKGLKKVTKQVAKLAADPEVKLPVKSKGKAKKKLNKKGKAKVKAEVTFTPTGGSPNTESTKIKLVKR